MKMIIYDMGPQFGLRSGFINMLIISVTKFYFLVVFCSIFTSDEYMLFEGQANFSFVNNFNKHLSK